MQVSLRIRQLPGELSALSEKVQDNSRSNSRDHCSEVPSHQYQVLRREEKGDAGSHRFLRRQLRNPQPGSLLKISDSQEITIPLK